MTEKKFKVTKIIRKDGISYRPAGGGNLSNTEDPTKNIIKKSYYVDNILNADSKSNSKISKITKDNDRNQQSKLQVPSTSSGKKKILRKIIKRADGSTVVVADGKIIKVIKSKTDASICDGTKTNLDSETVMKDVEKLKNPTVLKDDKETNISGTRNDDQIEQLPKNDGRDDRLLTQSDLNVKQGLTEIKRTFLIDKSTCFVSNTKSAAHDRNYSGKDSSKEELERPDSKYQSRQFKTNQNNHIPSQLSRSDHTNKQKYNKRKEPSQHLSDYPNLNIEERHHHGKYKSDLSQSPSKAQSSKERYYSPQRIQSPRKKFRHTILQKPKKSLSPTILYERLSASSDEGKQRYYNESPKQRRQSRKSIRQNKFSDNKDDFSDTRILTATKDTHDIDIMENMSCDQGDKHHLITIIQKEAEDMLKAQHNGPIDEKKRQKLKKALQAVLIKRGILNEANTGNLDHSLYSDDSSDERETHLLERLHNKYSDALKPETSVVNNTTLNIADSEDDNASLESVKIQPPISDVSCSDMEVSDEETQRDNEDGMTPAFRKKSDNPIEIKAEEQKSQPIQIKLGQDREEEAFNNLASQLEKINTSADVSNLIEAIENKIKSFLALNLEPSNLEKKIRRYQMLVAKVVMKAETIKEQEDTSDVTYHRPDVVYNVESVDATNNYDGYNAKKNKPSRFSDCKPAVFPIYDYDSATPNEVFLEFPNNQYSEAPLQPNQVSTNISQQQDNINLLEQIRLQYVSQREGYHVCLLCMSETNSEKQFEKHLNGKKHHDAVQQKINQITKPIDKKKYKNHPVVIRCQLCDVTTLSQQKYNDHCLHRSHIALTQAYLKIGRVIPEPEIIQDQITKEKEEVEKIQGSDTPAVGREYMTTKRSKDCDDNVVDVYYCNICKVNCNTEVQVEKHVRSNKHYLKYVKTSKPEVNIPVNIAEHKRRRATTNKIVSTMKTIRKMEEAIEKNRQNLEAEYFTTNPLFQMNHSSSQELGSNTGYYATNRNSFDCNINTKLYSETGAHSMQSLSDENVGKYSQTTYETPYNEMYLQYAENYTGKQDVSLAKEKANINYTVPQTFSNEGIAHSSQSSQYYRDLHLQSDPYKSSNEDTSTPSSNVQEKNGRNLRLQNQKSTYHAVYESRKRMSEKLPSSKEFSGNSQNSTISSQKSASTISPLTQDQPPYQVQQYNDSKQVSDDYSPRFDKSSYNIAYGNTEQLDYRQSTPSWSNTLNRQAFSKTNNTCDRKLESKASLSITPSQNPVYNVFHSNYDQLQQQQCTPPSMSLQHSNITKNKNKHTGLQRQATNLMQFDKSNQPRPPAIQRNSTNFVQNNQLQQSVNLEIQRQQKNIMKGNEMQHSNKIQAMQRQPSTLMQSNHSQCVRPPAIQQQSINFMHNLFQPKKSRL